MKRLTGLDGVSLHGETGVMPTHVMAVMFCDSAPRGELTAGAVFRLLAQRTAATPAFRQRLLNKPFGLGQPVWIEDPEFDVHKHVHRVRLPKPGTTSELAALVGKLHGRRLNRDRALWDAWVVQGLADGRVAVVIKFSHAMSDGVGAVTSILPELMTTDPDHVFPAIPDRAPAEMPGVSAKMYDVIDEIAANTAAGVRIALRVAPAAVESVADNVRGAIRHLLPAVGAQTPDRTTFEKDDYSPRTRLNAPLTARRSVAFADVAMDDLRVITDAFDVTINDVFLTATTSALRRWLDEHEAIPEGPLRTFMPISTRSADDHASNSWSPTIVEASSPPGRSGGTAGRHSRHDIPNEDSTAGGAARRTHRPHRSGPTSGHRVGCGSVHRPEAVPMAFTPCPPDHLQRAGTKEPRLLRRCTCSRCTSAGTVV